MSVRIQTRRGLVTLVFWGTEKQHHAMTLALRHGAVFAGKGNRGERHGSMSDPVFGSTLRNLERRGLLGLSIGPDGGMMGCPTEHARSLWAGRTDPEIMTCVHGLELCDRYGCAQKVAR